MITMHPKHSLKYSITRFVFAIILLGCTFSPVSAQTRNTLDSNKEQPLEIAADGAFEWDRNNKTYTARGNAMAKQGTVTIYADVLSADYKETKSSSFDIELLSATGNVKIQSESNSAYGNKAIYDVHKGIATITGDNLKMVSQNETVTARERFEYDVVKKKLTAIGNVTVLRGENTIDAERMKAIFRENPDGTSALQRLEAHGNVKITTPTEILYSKEGIYDASSAIVKLAGDVEIFHGDNILNGERAELDLNTNISRMFGSSENNGRVKGTFYPKSKDTDVSPEQEDSDLPVTN
jgi:lipopolysaccharide export system protein LptA